MKNCLLISILLLTVFSGCKKDSKTPTKVNKDKISGYVQKGPFINGTSISIYELNDDLSQTGKTYNTQIVDNNGSFGFSNVELTSRFVSLKADGFYFNEISGEQSKSQITLYALSDISDRSTINVNILSHLEKSRVEYLMSKGMDFKEAKNQTQSEILKIFSIDEVLAKESESLDIAKKGSDNGILLAISLIFQGYRTEGELTELLANISNDIKEDGILDNKTLGAQLINHAVYLKVKSIREYLEKRYADIGVNAEIPNFEDYIQQFIENTPFVITESLIKYTASGEHGKNILDVNEVNYSGEQFSFSANLSKGMSLKIKMTSLSSGDLFMNPFSSKNWNISEYDLETKSQYFTAIDPDKNCDLLMSLDNGKFLIEYFEMGATEPNRSKIITKF